MAIDTREESFEAIQAIAETVRAQILEALEIAGPMTADELAVYLGIDRLTVRPRCTELRKRRLIEDSGERRVNASGKRAIVWRLRLIEPSWPVIEPVSQWDAAPADCALSM